MENSNSNISDVTSQQFDLGVPETTLEFENREQLIGYAKEWAIQKGFCLTMEKGSDKTRALLKCDLGGEYRKNTNKGIRLNTSSRLIGCTYKIAGRASAGDKKWRIKVVNQYHTHDSCPQDQMISRSQARAQCLKSKKQDINSLITTVEPRKIAASLRREDPNIRLISRDLANLRAKRMREVLHGRTPIHALLDRLISDDVPHRHKVDEQNHVTHLFFAFPDAIRMSILNHTVLVVDSTYKTNKFRMPLVHAIGVSSTYQTFSAFFCFLKSEKESDYEWTFQAAQQLLGSINFEVIMTDNDLTLMNAIKIHYPNSKNLLCNWHIWKNIMAKHRGSFSSKEAWDNWEKAWKSVVQETTEESFQNAWIELKSRSPQNLVQYVEKQWMPYKEAFARPYTSKFRHLGHSTSSRAEGAHAKIKGYIEVSTSNLYTVFEKLKNSHMTDISEISAQVGQQQQNIGRRFRIPFFANVNSKVSHKALVKVADMIENLKVDKENNLGEFSLQFSRVWGMPCKHMLLDMLNINKPIEVSDFCQHWHLRNLGEVSISSNAEQMAEEPISEVLSKLQDDISTWGPHQQSAARIQLERIRGIGCQGSLTAISLGIQEPNVIRPKGRPMGAPNNSYRIGMSKKRNAIAESSTRREPSEFEHRANAVGDSSRSLKRPRSSPTCSECRSQGHDRRNCPTLRMVEENDGE